MYTFSIIGFTFWLLKISVIEGIFPSFSQAACQAVTAILMYFLLAAFCWMLCEGVMLYLMLVVVFSSLSKKWWFFFILGWREFCKYVNIFWMHFCKVYYYCVLHLIALYCLLRLVNVTPKCIICATEVCRNIATICGDWMAGVLCFLASLVLFWPLVRTV